MSGFRASRSWQGEIGGGPGPQDGIHAPMAAGLSSGSPARTIGLPIKVTLVS